ncbi:MAG: hypothetical protein ACYDBJ_07785 [Aggregatilineales bacterium]
MTALPTAVNTAPIRADQIVPVEHRQIAAILFVDAPSADRPVELRVALRDGRAFAFTAYTPAALNRILGDNGSRQLSVVDSGLLIVAQVTPAAIIDALDQMLAIGIERFGLAL